MTYALDTFVLVRILANRPQPLASDVIADVAARIADGDAMYVSNLVASEAKSVLALDGLEHMNPGFVDRLIHGESERQGMPVLSCEKSFRHLINAEVIP